MTIRAEICILGGGPAGAAAALKLARLGHHVLVLEKEAFPRPHVGESLAPGIWPQLDLLGLSETVRGAGFLPAPAARVHWEGRAETLPGPSSPAGLLVDRGRFDQLLLAAAQEAGARFLQPARALRPRRIETGWAVPVLTEGKELEIETLWLVDATGRASRLGGRKIRTGPATVALHASWPSPPWRETRVEAGEDEWLWGAPLPDGTFSAMAFLDAERYRSWRRAGKSRESLYREILARTVLLRDLLATAPPARVLACDATCRHDPEPVGDGFLKLGEAAFAIDPLSSSGVQVALRTAWSGSIALHTLLTRPDREEAARRFYLESQEHSVRRHAAWSAGYYAQAGRGASSFWSRRSEGAAPAGPEPADGVWDPESRLRLSEAAVLVETPCIAGDLIEIRRALAHPHLDRSVAFLDDIEVAPLLEAIPEEATLSRLAAAWSARLPPKKAFEVAWWLIRRGVLVAP